MTTEPEFIGGIPHNEHKRLHSNLRRWNGSASKCENQNCQNKDAKKFEWALKKGYTYSDDKNDYLQLCVSCHRKYDITDDTRRKFSEYRKGKKMGSENHRSAKVIDTVTGHIFNTLSDAAASINVKRTTLIAWLSGQNKNKTNLQYYGEQKKRNRRGK